MKPHPRIRKTIKWAGLVSCVLIGGLYATSVWAQWGVPTIPGVSPSPGSRTGVHIGFSRGGMLIATVTVPNPPTYPRPTMWYTIQSEGRAEWLPNYDHIAAASSGGWEIRFVSIPLWIGLVGAAIPTARAWRLDTLARRRARVGFCPKCSYDQAGLAAGAVCPECGGGSISI